MITGDTLIKFFEACKNSRFLIQLHSITIKAGLTHSNFFAAKLIDLYTRFTNFRIALKLFDETPNRTVRMWNGILRCYCGDKRYHESLLLFSQLFSSKRSDLYTVQTALKACVGLKALDFGKTIHGIVKKSYGIGGNLFVGSALVELYSKCGNMDDALQVFEEYPEPDTVLWTTIITGYEQNGEPLNALEFFARMAMAEGVEIDSITLVSAVSACVKLLDLNAGRSIHGYMIRVGIGNGLSLFNALLNLYGKTGSVNAAMRLFSKMEVKDVISWGSMLSCYAHHGRGEEALDLFDDIVAIGIEPNAVVLFSALQACEATHDLKQGKIIHKLAIDKGLNSDILVSTALIDMYMNCCSPNEAIEVFDCVPIKDSVCYSAMLHGCVQNGMAFKSLEIFHDMLANDLEPDGFDLVPILTACSELGVLQLTSCIHGFTMKYGLDTNSFFRASLIESYAKCGSLDGSIAVFRQIKDRDVVTWSSMFSAYGLHGRAREALNLFDQMIKNPSVTPNKVSFLSILSACSHAGLITEGIEMLNVMVKDYNLTPDQKHYSILVDLIGRIGELEKAMALINRIEGAIEADVWGAFLGACRIYEDTKMGEMAAKKLLELDPFEAGHYVLVANMHAVDEKWENAAEVRKMAEEKQLKKRSGQSVISIRNEVHTFTANDTSHQESKKILQLLTILERMMMIGEWQ